MDRFNRNVQWDIKRSVYVASAFHLFYYGGKACLFPFLTLYFRQIGLTASQTGLALGIKAFLWFCVSPIWMGLANRVNKTRTILCYSIFIVIGSNLALTLLPPADPKLPLYVCLNESPPIENTWVHGSHIPLNIMTTALPISENLTVGEVTTALEKQDINTIFSTTPLTIKSSTPTTPITKSAQTSTLSTRATRTTTAHISSSSNTKEKEQLPTTSTSTLSRTTKEQSVFTLPTTSTSTLSTTTKEQSVFTSTKISPYRLAQKLVPIFEENGYTSGDRNKITKFISVHKVTKDWPSWKQDVIVNKIIASLEYNEENESPRPSAGGRSPFSHRFRRWSSHIARRKREDNDTSSSSLFDKVNNYINLTSLSEKKDAALKNLTHTLKNFAKEITPYLSSNTYLFWCVMIILVVGELLSAPVEQVSDNALYNLLDELDNLNQYGKHRISALVGVALCGLSVSIIVYFSPCFINGTINRFHIHFYLFALLLGISFMLAPFYPSYDPASNSARGRISGGRRQKCSTCSPMICSSCRHFLLFVTIFIVGVTQAPMQNFMLWMVQDMEGSSELVYGSFVSANAICAMVSSLFGRKLIKILKPWTVALISLLSIAIQLVLYAFLPSPWFIIPMQLLNITGLSFLWTIVTHHTSTTMSSAYEGAETVSSVHVFARASQQRTLHATYVSVYQGLSFSFGSIMSGFLYDYFQGNMSPLLVGGGILVAVWGLIFATYQCCCLPRKLRRKYSHLVSDSDSDVNLADNQGFGKKNTEKNGSYYSVRDAAKKKRSKDRRRKTRIPLDTDSNSSDTDHDWLKATMKKDSML